MPEMIGIDNLGRVIDSLPHKRPGGAIRQNECKVTGGMKPLERRKDRPTIIHVFFNIYSEKSVEQRSYLQNIEVSYITL